MRVRSLFRGIPLLVVALTTSIAGADVVGISSIAYTGTGVEFFPDENHLIDGSGLSGVVATEADFLTATHGNAGTNVAWVTDAPNGGTGDYFNPAGAGTVVFDIGLDNTYSVGQIASWGYHFGAFNGNGISVVSLGFSTDGGTTISSTQTGIALAQSAGSASLASFTATNANFLRLTVTDNHFGAPNTLGGDRVGLAEIRFATAAAIPEPTSFGILGLSAIGLIARRRRSN